MILDEIVEAKAEELTKRKQDMPLSALEKLGLKGSKKDFAAALKGDDIRLIAEVKMASPSRGVLRTDLDPVKLARIYAQNGAAAISVLTEERYFGGSLEHLAAIGEAMDNIPLLRKDFIFDPYQVYESRAGGASALLLIVAILSDSELSELLSLSHELGLMCLVEVHNQAELERAIMSGAQIIGINNRDLKTFAVDLETTRRLRPLIPQDRIVVSESGIKDRGDVQKLRQWGVDAMLVGEALVTAGDIDKKVKELL
ncbi:MAG TPA: indole-3-glycerol phosphate synthase TrpC [Dehalococcoidia bacterium]|nr:indole-3-glycerol phosphate synthase TrpC [Dehalococcoidia bacterium]